MHLSVISPQKTVLETECLQVSVPTTTGIITILPRHTALYSILKPGDVIVKTEAKKTETLVVNGGFVSVLQNKVTLLTDFGIHIEDIDEEIVKEAKKRAEKAMEEKLSDEHFATNKAELFKALLQLSAIRRHKSKTL